MAFPQPDNVTLQAAAQQGYLWMDNGQGQGLGDWYRDDQSGVPTYFSGDPGAVYIAPAPVAAPAVSAPTSTSSVASAGGATGSSASGAGAFAPSQAAREAEERRRFANAIFFGTAPMENFGQQEAPWFQGAGYYAAVPTPAWYMGPDSGEAAPAPYEFIGAQAPEGLREGQIGGVARTTPGNPFSMGEADYMAPQNFAVYGVLQDILNARGQDLWDFANIYAQAAPGAVHGLGDVAQFGVTPEELAYLTQTYGGENLFDLGEGMQNPYLQMTMRGDLPEHTLAQGGYLSTAQGMYDYFSQIPGALEDPQVQEYLMAMYAAQQEAAPHEQAFQEAKARRAAYGRMAGAMLASLPLGAAMGASMAAANAAAAGGANVGLTAAQKALLGGLGNMARTGLQGAEIGDVLKAGVTGGLGGVATGMLSGGGGLGNIFGEAGAGFNPESLDLSMSPEIGGMAEQVMPAGGFDNLFGPTSYLNQPGFMRATSLDAALAGSTGPLTDQGILVSAPGYEGLVTEQGFQAMTPAELAPIMSGAGFDVPAGYGAAPEIGGDLGGYTPEQIEGTTPPAEQLTAQDALRYAQQAQKLYGLVKQFLGGEDEALPERREDQSDADYWQDIAVDYLGLDADTMAEAGLEPGTPEYMDYILQQADSIIAQIFGADPSALEGAETVEDLQAALRGKTRQEMQQLSRALQVRGQLGQMASAREAIDPFTGMTEELGGDFMGQRDVAAAQRGRAREIEQLAGLRGAEARGMLGGLLDRNADIFGLRASMNARKIQEMLESMSQEDEERRRRYSSLGAMPGAGAEWMAEFESLGDPVLQQLLAGLGGNEEESRAALAALFGLEE